MTGGLELALQCTFLVASERAQFADTHARLGVMPGGGITVLMAQSDRAAARHGAVPHGKLLDRRGGPPLGLVNHVVPHDELLPFTRGWPPTS